MVNWVLKREEGELGSVREEMVNWVLKRPRVGCIGFCDGGNDELGSETG